MTHRLFKILSSLQLTVVLLSFSLVLVFIGTLAQVPLGLYQAQAEYFRSLFVYWRPDGANWKIPVFPGGWLLGGLLLVNLLAAHAKRFQLSWKKSGILLVHFGLILLLVGQFLTEVYQIESNMRIETGETRNYSEDSHHNELAVIDTSHPERDEVVAIPESLLRREKEIHHPSLPFTIRLKEFFKNSAPTGPMSGEPGLKATHGLGKRLPFVKLAETNVMDDENKPAALIEIVGAKGPVGEYLVSVWLSKYPWNAILEEQMGKLLGDELRSPQTFEFNGKTYEIALRPIRYYKPYSLTLLKATHEKYKGTEMAKNFASQVHLKDPTRNEDREVLIFMNNPMRYAGETFFQHQMQSGGTGSTTLLVVDNPAAITPYLSCSLMTLGLLIQFIMHLVNFGRRRKTAATTTPATAPAMPAPAGRTP